MAKILHLFFLGQGAQYSGMGNDFYNNMKKQNKFMIMHLKFVI